MNIDENVIDFENQRRKMVEILSGYKAKISKLESSVKKNSVPDSTRAQSEEVRAAVAAVASLREKFREALSEADARAAALEEENQALENQLQEYETRIKYLEAHGGGASQQVHPEFVPVENIQHHSRALGKATSLLAEINPTFGPPSPDEDENSRSRALFTMQQKLFQLHVKFIHSSEEEDLNQHAAVMEEMDDEELELALFWFRGASCALGGIMRGKQTIDPPSPESPLDDEPVNIAWGDQDEEEEQQVWESEEDDDPDGGHKLDIEPFMGFVPHWKRNLNLPELDSFEYIAQHADEYVGPSDESNWVLPGVFLVGAFPGCPDDDENWELITGILSLGVTTFVCLQDEYSDDALEEDWRYERNGAIRPYFRDVKEIVAQVEESPEDFPDIHVTSSQIDFVHFPIIDCDIAEDDSVYGLAVKLVDRLDRGEVIYLHCWGGHGRAGTVVSIMLHLMYGLGAEGAMERCQFVHDLRRVPMEVPSPQKPSQRNQVRRIVAALQEVEAMIPK